MDYSDLEDFSDENFSPSPAPKVSQLISLCNKEASCRDFAAALTWSETVPLKQPVLQAKAKKAVAAKPLAVSNVSNLEAATAPAPAQKGKPAAENKSIEEIYQKKTQLEHILLRPDTYIGSTEKQDQQLWVHDGTRMVLSSISYVPGLYKIFDEILVNAADNKVRDPSMDTVKVTIDVVSGEKVKANHPLSQCSATSQTLMCLDFGYFLAGRQLHSGVEQWQRCAC
jgi:hypothetical protein